jgi:arylformamidase
METQQAKLPVQDRRTFRLLLMLLLLATVALWLSFEVRKPWPTVVHRPVVPAVATRKVGNLTLCVMTDLPYALSPTVNPEQQMLDLYVPEGARNAPMLVYIHGGGWDGGNKDGIGKKAEYYAARGYVVASVNYRLSPVSVQYNGAMDVAAALKYLRFIAPRIGADPQRIYAMGHSAGAHLLALAICDERYLAASPGMVEAIRGVMLLDGSAYYVPWMMLSERGEGFAGVFGDDVEGWISVSPSVYIKRGRRLPPMLLVHATGDEVRKSSAQVLAEALQAGGYHCLVLSAPGLSHAKVDTTIGSDSDDLTRWINGFLADPEREIAQRRP